jgi:hypothetical protein
MDVNEILMNVQRRVEQRYLSRLGRSIYDIEHLNIVNIDHFHVRPPPKIQIVVGSMGDCAICQEDFAIGDEYITLQCNPTHPHCFHKDCIQPWLSGHDTCPTCRGKV